MEETSVIVLGLVIGSFLNVCIHRIPRGQSIVTPPSSCPDCGTALLWRHKVPVVSYAFLRGRCFLCRRRIPLHYPLIEMGTAVLGIILYLKYGPSAEFFLAAGLMLILIVISGVDFQILRIPNALLGFGLGLWLVIALGTPAHLMPGLLGVFAGSGSLFPVAVFGRLLYKKPSLGAGDIKLAGLIGLFLGFQGVAFALIVAIVTGGAVGIVGLLSGHLSRKSELPFGVFLSFGTFWYLTLGKGLGWIG